MNIHFSILDTSSVSSILPFIQELTHRKFSDAVLLERFQKMIDQN